MPHQIVFIVDDARLEAQALLLAATLHDRCKTPAQLVAYVPEARLKGLSALTHRMFEICKVELRGFSLPEATWRKPYPHGNKIIACADAERRAADQGGAGQSGAGQGGAGQGGAGIDRITFLDTDMLCQTDFLAALPPGDQVLAVPEGLQTWGKKDGDWARAYGYFNLPLPEERVRLLRGRKALALPYFNAGLVSFPMAPARGWGLGFAQAWLDTARRFDDCPIADKRPWLDQITLPLTLYRHGFDWAALTGRRCPRPSTIRCRT